MRKFIMAVFSMVLVGLSLAFIAPAANAGTDKIGICHATGNGKYVYIEISKDGTASGHAGEEHQDGEDIIPAYSWVEDQVRYYFDGQNLDKIDILTNGCKSPVATVTASPVPPTYVPATCARPELPYGEVIVPADKGEGVASATEPTLNAEKTVWSVSYALVSPTEDKTYTWPVGSDGSFTFNVVPISADPFWVVDSKTGTGECTLPETGAADYLVPIGGAAILLALGAVLMRANKRTV